MTIKCPTVFKDTSVERRLSRGELFAMFDVPSTALPPPMRSELDLPISAIEARVHPYLYEAPLKVLQKVFEMWLDMPYSIDPPPTPLDLHPAWSLPGIMYHTGSEFEVEAAYRLAVKADDALVPTHLWDDRIWRVEMHMESQREAFVVRYSRCPLATLRGALLCHWRTMIRRSFLDYLVLTYGTQWMDCAATLPALIEDLQYGRDCLVNASDSDWWEWKGGSSLIFWRWPAEFRAMARAGHPVWVKSSLPNYRRPQRQEDDPAIQTQIRAKLENVLRKGYISKGQVTSLTSYFAVPKGTNDVRMVYDSTKSGLDAALWVPSFSLPTVDTLTDMLEASSWMSDLDMGEQFLNFPLDPALGPFCGIDVRPYLGSPAGSQTHWLCWTRCMMGLMLSPYITNKGAHIAEETVLGDRLSPSNPLRWDHVKLNLPGMSAYDPTQPWVSRRREDGSIAAGVCRFVDDLRPVGPSVEECWSVTHTLACCYNHLGLQITSRKTRPPSQHPGAWAGSHVVIQDGNIGVTCGVEKWLKAKRLLDSLLAELNQGPQLVHKTLEQWRGFFVHLQRTYPCITPFLKGVHLTLDGWRPGRDSEGWKTPSAYVDADMVLAWGMESLDTPLEAPTLVTAVPRLRDDLSCLAQLFQPDHSPVRFIHSTNITLVTYGFGDASGSGFGHTQLLPDGSIQFRHGTWGSDADCPTSNFRELVNLVTALEEGVRSGSLHHSEVFMFTDNTTAEGCFYKGNSPSRQLFSLVLRLRLLEMTGQVRLHMIHVAGSRMIAQGTDGLSCGAYAKGVMAGTSMISFIPLHLDAIHQLPQLLEWVNSWSPASITPLTPEGWYTDGHGLDCTAIAGPVWEPQPSSQQVFLWTPAPAAAYAAVDELSLSRLKRPHLLHVFLCPRLCTHMWRKKLFKVTDVVLELPSGPRPEWPACMHEPLILAFVLPFIPHPPW
jgi:hypothetical protein